MKIKIGKYKNYFGCYQLAELLCFWAKKEKDEYGFKNTAEWVHNFGAWLSGGDDKDSWLHNFFSWIDSKRKRNIKVKIDRWDTWNMCNTLGIIILPMLKQLIEQKQGSPFVDDEDVPEELKSTTASPKENEWDIDDNHHKRWEYALKEMLFSFECLNDDSWEEKFHSGEHDIIWVPSLVDENGKTKTYQMEKGTKDTYKCDYDGMKVVQSRIDNGFRLFGKYFQHLWS